MEHGPSKGFETKGLEDGLCNRGACLAQLDSVRSNQYKHRFNGWHYCQSCAMQINERNMWYDGKPLCEKVNKAN